MSVLNYFRIAVFLILTSSMSMCRKTVSNSVGNKFDTAKYELQAKIGRINDAFGGYYVALPPEYNYINNSFPLLFFLHGQGQMGNGNEHLTYLLNDGIGKWINDGKIPTAFHFDGKTFSFIVVSPQYSRQPTTAEILECVEYMKTTYRVDLQRVYLAGLSLGAKLTILTAASRPEDFAGVVAISGAPPGNQIPDICAMLANVKLPIWELHNSQDPLANPEDAQNFINCLLQTDSDSRDKITIFDRYGHDAWTAALNPEFAENGLNIYEWMLQFKR